MHVGKAFGAGPGIVYTAYWDILTNADQGTLSHIKARVYYLRFWSTDILFFQHPSLTSFKLAVCMEA